MSNAATPLPWKHLRYILILFSPLWMGSAMLFAALGAAYSIATQDYWTASQPMVLRDEANGAADRLGRFGSQTDLKAAQETILEMARNHEVVKLALKQIGPEGGGSDESDNPNGMSSTMLTGGGAAAGLIFGLGAVFLVAPGPNQSRFGRRWSDVLGRRASDQNARGGNGQVERKVNAPGERRSASRA